MVIRVVIWAKMQDPKISYLLVKFLTNCMSLEEWIPCVTQSRATDGPSVHRELCKMFSRHNYTTSAGCVVYNVYWPRVAERWNP